MAGGSSAALQGISGTIRVNSLPSPFRLVTVISPFSSAASLLEMDSPRPVPPKLRVVDPSAWVKGLNSLASTSGAIPMPVSRSAKLRRAPE